MLSPCMSEHFKELDSAAGFDVTRQPLTAFRRGYDRGVSPLKNGRTLIGDLPGFLRNAQVNPKFPAAIEGWGGRSIRNRIVEALMPNLERAGIDERVRWMSLIPQPIPAPQNQFFMSLLVEFGDAQREAVVLPDDEEIRGCQTQRIEFADGGAASDKRSYLSLNINTPTDVAVASRVAVLLVDGRRVMGVRGNKMELNSGSRFSVPLPKCDSARLHRRNHYDVIFPAEIWVRTMHHALAASE